MSDRQTPTNRFTARARQSQTPRTGTAEDAELGAVPPTQPTQPAATTAAASTSTMQSQPAKTPLVAASTNAPLLGSTSPKAPQQAAAPRYPPVPRASPPTQVDLAEAGKDIPNEPVEEPEDEDPNEPEETKEEKTSWDRVPGFWYTCFQILVALLMLVPFIILYFTKDFPWYNIIDVKGPPDALNPFMEFGRWSFFIAIAYACFSVLDYALGTLPTHILSLFNWFNLFKSKRVKRQIGYMRNIHPYLTACIFFLLLFWLGGIFIYSTAAAGPALKLGPLSGAGGAAAGAAATAAEPVIQDSRYYVERFLILAAILSGAIAFEKYLLEAIRAKFHRMALAARIKDINYRVRIATALYAGVSNNQPHITVLPASVPAGADDIYLTMDKSLGLTSVSRARSIASKIFEGLRAGSNRSEIYKEDVGKVIMAADLDPAFDNLDVNKNGSLDEEEVTEYVVDLYEDFLNVRASLVGNARIVGKLDRLILIIAVILGLALAIPFFDVGLGKAWATFGVISTAFGFMFQNAGKICFESLIFVFVEHAFDVGDRITVDGENMVVQNIEIFTTRFVRWDGLIVYAPNAVLSGKYIYNVRRSGMQSEQIIAQIAAKTTTEQLRQVLDKLKALTEKETKDFTGFVDIVEFNVLDKEKMEVKFTVQYKSNFQNQAQRNARKTKFNTMLKDTLAELAIEYYPPT